MGGCEKSAIHMLLHLAYYKWLAESACIPSSPGRTCPKFLSNSMFWKSWPCTILPSRDTFVRYKTWGRSANTQSQQSSRHSHRAHWGLMTVHDSWIAPIRHGWKIVAPIELDLGCCIFHRFRFLLHARVVVAGMVYWYGNGLWSIISTTSRLLAQRAHRQ